MKRRNLLKALPLLASTRVFSTVAAAQPDAKRPRLRSAICAYSFREALKAGTMKYEDLIRLAVETEVDGLDLTVYWFPNTSDAFLLPLKRQAYRSAVEIYSISIRTNMCQPTPELRERELVEVRKWVDAAEKLGAGHIRVFGGDVPKGSTEDQAAGWVVEILKRAADYSGPKGIILGLENHGGITEKAERIVEIVRQVDSPWVGINLDTGNFRRDTFRQVEMCIPHSANVQVKAEMRDEAGKVVPSDWSRFAGMLVRGGYQGYLALEYEASENPATAVPRLLRRLRDVIHAQAAARA